MRFTKLTVMFIILLLGMMVITGCSGDVKPDRKPLPPRDVVDNEESNDIDDTEIDEETKDEDTEEDSKDEVEDVDEETEDDTEPEEEDANELEDLEFDDDALSTDDPLGSLI